MTDEQVEALIKELRRVATALEQISRDTQHVASAISSSKVWIQDAGRE